MPQSYGSPVGLAPTVGLAPPVGVILVGSRIGGMIPVGGMATASLSSFLFWLHCFSSSNSFYK